MSAACMGGWACPKREHCRLHVQQDRTHVAERLCEPGQFDAYEPIRVRRKAGTWERPQVAALLKPATWFGALEAQ